MQMGEVAIGDFKTIQPCMDTADRQLMNAHMGKTFSVGWLNDEVCGKSIFFLLTRKTRFVLFRILVGLMVSVRCSILSADFWSDTRFTPSRFPAAMGHYPRKCFRHCRFSLFEYFFLYIGNECKPRNYIIGSRTGKLVKWKRFLFTNL